MKFNNFFLLSCFVFIVFFNCLSLWASPFDPSNKVIIEQKNSRSTVQIASENNLKTQPKTLRKKKKNNKKNTIKQLDIKELADLQYSALEKKDFSSAIKYLKMRMDRTTDPSMIAQLIFESGEINFEAGKFDQAIAIFEEFRKKFGSHHKIEDACYKLSLSGYLSMLDIHRDQTNTEKAVVLANDYLNHPMHFMKYRTEVQSFKTEALKKSAHHEIMICESQKRYGHLKAAKKRIEYVEKHFLKELPELAEKILALKNEFHLDDKQTVARSI